MTITLTEELRNILPPGTRRKPGFRIGDRVEVTEQKGIVTITPLEDTCTPSKAEWASIRQGEAALARGDSVSLSGFLTHTKTSSK